MCTCIMASKSSNLSSKSVSSGSLASVADKDAKQLTTDDAFVSYVEHICANYRLIQAEQELQKNKADFAETSKQRLDSIKDAYSEAVQWEVLHEKFKRLSSVVEIIQIQFEKFPPDNDKLRSAICRLEKLTQALNASLQRVRIRNVKLPSNDKEWGEFLEELTLLVKLVNDMDERLKEHNGLSETSKSYLELILLFSAVKVEVEKLKTMQRNASKMIIKEQSMRVSENLLKEQQLDLPQ